MSSTWNVLEVEITPQPHRFVWWVMRPTIALLCVTVIGIPIGLGLGAALAKPLKEHKAWIELRRQQRGEVTTR